MMRLKSHHYRKRRLLFCNHKHDYNNKDNNHHRAILFVVVVLITLSLISLILFSPSGIPKSYAHAFTIKSDSSSPSELLPKLPSKVDVYRSEPVKLSQLNFSIQEFKTPYNNSQLLYPVYDKNRNVIWVGDTIIDSGRILEYDLNTDKYTEHKVNGTSIVTIMTLDPNNNNQLWYVDPLMKNLGQYNIVNGATRLYKIPSQGVISGIAADSNNNIWLTSPSTNEILRFDAQAKNFTTTIPLPTANAQPFGITVDRFGQIWIAESGIGKLANIDPTKGYRISEYAPTNENDTLASPTAVLADPNTRNIYISQHDGHAVSVFNPILKTFNQYPQLDPNGLPFGMAFDGYGNLWVAEHTINKIAVIDLRTNTSKEINIPTQSPFVQWLTSDSKGNIWLAEQQGNSLGVITTAATKKLPQPTTTTTTTAATATITAVASPTTGNQTSNNNNNNNNNGTPLGVPRLGFSYADIVGPSSLAG